MIAHDVAKLKNEPQDRPLKLQKEAYGDVPMYIKQT